RLEQVQPGDAMNGRSIRNALIVGKNVDLRGMSVSDSIILADGSFEAERIRGSVVVARSTVGVNLLSTYCVFIAGTYVKLEQCDGQPGNSSNGSLVVTRGWLDLEMAYGTIVAASKGATIRRNQGATIINAPVPPQLGVPAAIAQNNGSRSVDVPD